MLISKEKYCRVIKDFVGVKWQMCGNLKIRIPICSVVYFTYKLGHDSKLSREDGKEFD